MGRAVFANPSTGAHILLSGARSFQRKWQHGSLQGDLMPMSTPQNYHHQCLCPTVSTAVPNFTSTRDSPLLANRSDSILTKSLLFSPGFWCTQDLACTLKVEILFPPVMWNSCDQTLLNFKTRFSGAPLPFSRPLAWGSRHGLRTLTSMGKLLV